jgi:hypothetical protein
VFVAVDWANMKKAVLDFRKNNLLVAINEFSQRTNLIRLLLLTWSAKQSVGVLSETLLQIDEPYPPATVKDIHLGR